ncbi:MAG: L-rhamnose isomerase, partial [bacterium]|nr:L-rhamnose isomerase [bacterium]
MSKVQYEAAKKQYAALGVDTEKAIKTLQKISISMHCWQGDDVTGFENDAGATGGIQTTGNYPGKARTPEELMKDVEFAMSLIPG